ncbi:MAG: cysteine desulfurase [Sphingobacteriales bacterium]|nr:cysteine desulfurase [Sphingobacteriales bacterium]OJW33274.1 MAG: cysteine sulfinate desulfinase [Sphingobacteriales bacterium 46-32]
MEVTTGIPVTYDVQAVRKQFPILSREVKGHPLIYLDNAATTQKPQAVVDSLLHYYTYYNANIHRGIHTLAEEATAAYEATRDAVKAFINAAVREEIIFTRGTTESINLVAYTWGMANVKAGDEIIVSGMEHHSNTVPWQLVCERNGARLRVIPVNEQGELDMEVFHSLLSEKTKLVSLVHVSNALGTINPVSEVIAAAHKAGALVMLDGAQSTVHMDIDVQALDCDFFACSSHKVYGPTGVGVLYGKKALLEAMPVFQGGGEMIREVTFEKTTYNELPYKFEAGTPNIADTIAFKAAIDYVTELGRARIRRHEDDLLQYATGLISDLDGVQIIGQAKEKTSVLSFIVKNAHPQDLGILLDNKGIAVRTGHHCAQPLMDRFCIPGTVRASFALYNTREEVDQLAKALKKAISLLS